MFGSTVLQAITEPLAGYNEIIDCLFTNITGALGSIIFTLNSKVSIYNSGKISTSGVFNNTGWKGTIFIGKFSTMLIENV